MKKENISHINAEPVVPTVLEKMTMSGWLMTPWKWPIIRNLKTRRTVWIILTSPTLSLYPAPVLQQRPGPVWWEFTALLTRPTRADLSGDTLFTLINCITLVTDGKYQYQYHDWKYQEYQLSGELEVTWLSLRRKMALTFPQEAGSMRMVMGNGRMMRHWQLKVL